MRKQLIFRKVTWIFLLLVTIGLVACGGGEVEEVIPTPEPPPPTAEPAAEPTDVPQIWSRFRYVANSLVRAGKADIYCMKCNAPFGPATSTAPGAS